MDTNRTSVGTMKTKKQLVARMKKMPAARAERQTRRKSLPPERVARQSRRSPSAKAARDLIIQATQDISLVHPAIRTELAVKPAVFRVRLDILNRETGKPCTIDFTWPLPPLLSSREHALDWIYACVRDAWVHELNEALFVDGIRRHELHTDGGQVIPPPGEDARAGDLASFKVQLAAFLSGSAPVTGRPQTDLDAFKVQFASFLMGAPR